MLKRLPLNKRASDYALQAGFNPPPQFYGDVFIGRTQQKPKLKNVPFVLGYDTAMDAPWLKSAINDNLAYQMEMNQITGQKDVRQPSVAGQDGQAKIEDGYSWTQTEGELDVVVVFPPDATSKEIDIKFHPRSLQVSHNKVPKIFLQLFERVDIDSCTWTLDKSKAENRVVISMEKQEEAFWPRIED
jgi:CS domain